MTAEIAPGLYAKPDAVRASTYRTVTVSEGLELTVRDEVRDPRFDLNPASPFHDFAERRWTLVQGVRRLHSDQGLPVPVPANYAYWVGGNGHTFVAFLAGRLFKASGATRRKALRHLSDKMTAAWPGVTEYAAWVVTAHWSHNPEVSEASRTMGG